MHVLYGRALIGVKERSRIISTQYAGVQHSLPGTITTYRFIPLKCFLSLSVQQHGEDINTVFNINIYSSESLWRFLSFFCFHDVVCCCQERSYTGSASVHDQFRRPERVILDHEWGRAHPSIVGEVSAFSPCDDRLDSTSLGFYFYRLL